MSATTLAKERIEHKMRTTYSSTLRTMLERFMPIPDILEKVDLTLVRKECRSDRVYRRISPSFVVETTFSIKEVEELRISISTPEIEISNFEIGPEVTFIICFAVVVREEFKCVVCRQMFGVKADEFYSVRKSVST